MTQSADQTWTILRLINWTKDYLAGRGVESPRLAAEVLLASVLKCPRMALYTQFDREPTEPQRAAFRALVKRAADHEPVAYLTGRKDFYSLELTVTPDVLIPRPETELLAQQAIDFLKARPAPASCWDACTGSGAVAVAVGKHVPALAVLATDISPAALAVARENLDRHGLAERATTAEVNLLDLPGELAERAPFDAITANPPYVSEPDMAALPATVRHEPRLALAAGAEGLDAIAPILRQAAEHLKGGGLLAVEIGYNQADSVWALIKDDPRYESPAFVKDLAGIDRVLIAHARR